MAPSPRERAPYFAWLSILTGGALTPSFCLVTNHLRKPQRINLSRNKIQPVEIKYGPRMAYLCNGASKVMHSVSSFI